MGFTIEEGCPQCGAVLQLDETDHMLLCPYCGVKSLLFSEDFFRYVLPDNAPAKSLIYVPYLRFKGVIHFCRDMTLDHRIVDITHLGVEFNRMPVSLGLRPQAMKLRFINKEQGGAFLRFSLRPIDILTRAARLSSGPSKEGILHRAFIGETMSIIYLPVYLDGNRLFDGILNRPVASLPGGIDELKPLIIKNPGWGLRFIPTLCPHCGWKLDGKRDSVILLCRNCHRAWEIKEGSLKEIELMVVRGRNEDPVYIPFWKITADVKGVDIRSFSDFIRITNQPVIVEDERGKKDMEFFCPAFKIRPNFFLNLARQFTVMQRDLSGNEYVAEKEMYPVTLAKAEAIQALKVILASSAVSRKNIFPHLPGISFEIKGITLIYIPFMEGPNEMIHEDTGIAINKPSLEFGRRM